MSSRISLEIITPEIASEYLKKNSSNRKLKFANVRAYVADMKDGKWTPGLSMIQFYESGDIADGQNRLKAIELSGIPQSFFVRRGLKREDGLNIDRHAPRTLSDAARIAGVSDSVSNAIWSVARAVDTGTRDSPVMSHSQKLEIIARHREASEWALSKVKNASGIKVAAVTAAVARAYYAENDLDRLEKFCYVISTGFANGLNETAAVAIRNYLLANPKVTVPREGFRDTFLKIQNAIGYFMRGKPLTVIKSVGSEAYALKTVKE